MHHQLQHGPERLSCLLPSPSTTLAHLGPSVMRPSWKKQGTPNLWGYHSPQLSEACPGENTGLLPAESWALGLRPRPHSVALHVFSSSASPSERGVCLRFPAQDMGGGSKHLAAERTNPTRLIPPLGLFHLIRAGRHPAMRHYLCPSMSRLSK